MTLIAVWFAWVGHLGSDDKVHLDGAIGWLTDFPFVGQNHGAMRHLITIPAAISLKLFGKGEFQAVLPNLAYYFGLILLSFVFIRERWGRTTAFLFCAIVLSLPVFSVQATVVFSDTTELFFVALSFGFYLASYNKPNPRTYLALSGVCAGAAFFTRETTVALLLAYAVFFLLERQHKRIDYVWLGAGFAGALLAEALMMWVIAGAPLHRYTITLNEVVSLQQPPENNPTGMFDRIGNVKVHYLIDPFLVPLVNHEFGPLWFIAIVALILGWRHRHRISKTEQQTLLRLLIASALWFVIAMTIIREYRHPRYIAVSTYAIALVVALVLARLGEKRASRLPAMLASVAIGGGILCTYLDNRDPLFGERALLAQLPNASETVYTDRETAGRLKILLYFKEWTGRVIAAAPSPGMLYFENPNRTTLPKEWRNNACLQTLSATKPRATPHGWFLDAVGVAPLLPPDLYRRLTYPNREVRLLRLSRSPSDCAA